MYSKLIIVGNVGRDAEMRYTPSGAPVTSFSIATNRRWTNANGETQERTTWYKVTCWRKLAEIAAQYVVKGKLILVEAEEITASAYTGRDGEARATIEITAAGFKFLSGRNDNAGEDAEGESNTPEIGGDDSIPF
jgi:single-strand DNA-binding protein